MYTSMGTGLGLGGTISIVLVFIVKILFVLFIAGLFIGLAVFTIKHVFAPGDFEKIKNSIWRKKSKPTCAACGKELANGWKACPYCGTANSTTNE